MFELQETKLPVRLINTTNERRLVQGHGARDNSTEVPATPLGARFFAKCAVSGLLLHERTRGQCVTSTRLVPRKTRRVEERYTLNLSRAQTSSRWCGLVVRRWDESSDNFVALHFEYDQARRRFVEWAQNEIAVIPDFHKRILFSDETHFWLNGYVNKQNCRIWIEANPQVYVETPLHPEKLTVRCALWAGGILLQKR
ncbi:hypothetical protein TNCV_3504261 [Trichonephila clavipes]|uniref:Transposase n=1 Tax=Trichonephila clavipes TaxID=2585209 RepID=A0A8X6RXK9_TRICX|nr:hypothetical protein TNCV_3504261 [Trichonephila clavipes]